MDHPRRDDTTGDSEHGIPAETKHIHAERIDRKSGSVEPVNHDKKDLENRRSTELLPWRPKPLERLPAQIRALKLMTLTLAILVVLLAITVLVLLSRPATSEAQPSDRTESATETESPTSAPPNPTSGSALPSTSPSMPSATSASDSPTAGSAGTVPSIHSDGQAGIYSDCDFDLDDQNTFTASCGISSGDIVQDLRALSATDGASLAAAGAGGTDYARCSSVPDNAWTAAIPFSALSGDAAVCVKTNEGRLALVTITGIPSPDDRMSQMTFRYVTWGNQ